jgi:hypothetical protein
MDEKMRSRTSFATLLNGLALVVADVMSVENFRVEVGTWDPRAAPCP